MAATASAVSPVELGLQRRALLLQVGEHRAGGGERQGVLDHRPARGGDVRLREAVIAVRPRPAVDHVDVPAAPGDDADGQAATQDLAVRGDVRPEVEQPLDAALVGAEPGDDLVEHQEEAVLVGEPAQLAQELDRLQVRVPGPNRLHEHEREVRRIRPNDLEGALGPVLQDEGVVDDPLGNARPPWAPCGARPRTSTARPRTMSLRPWMSSVK